MKEYVRDEFIKIVFVKSADNTADIWTKNCSYDLYEKHRKDFLVAKEVIVSGEKPILGGCQNVKSILPQTTIGQKTGRG